jgi:hypothetical protein
MANIAGAGAGVAAAQCPQPRAEELCMDHLPRRVVAGQTVEKLSSSRQKAGLRVAVDPSSGENADPAGNFGLSWSVVCC